MIQATRNPAGGITIEEPMEVANLYYEADAVVKSAKRQLADAEKRLKPLQEQMLQLIEDGKLPTSFKFGRGSIYTQSQLWASPKDGDHERLSNVLESLGLVEFLPKTVNSQSISGFVREFRNELGEIVVQSEEHPDGLPVPLAEVLNISERTSVKASGN